MAACLVEQQLALEIARDLLDLDIDRSIRTDREAGWRHVRVHHRPLARPIVTDARVSVDMPSFQAVGPHDISVHGREHRFHVAGVETFIEVLEELSRTRIRFVEWPGQVGV